MTLTNRVVFVAHEAAVGEIVHCKELLGFYGIAPRSIKMPMLSCDDRYLVNLWVP